MLLTKNNSPKLELKYLRKLFLGEFSQHFWVVILRRSGNLSFYTCSLKNMTNIKKVVQKYCLLTILTIKSFSNLSVNNQPISHINWMEFEEVTVHDF